MLVHNSWKLIPERFREQPYFFPSLPYLQNWNISSTFCKSQEREWAVEAVAWNGNRYVSTAVLDVWRSGKLFRSRSWYLGARKIGLCLFCAVGPGLLFMPHCMLASHWADWKEIIMHFSIFWIWMAKSWSLQYHTNSNTSEQFKCVS